MKKDMKIILVALNARWTHSSLAIRYLRNEFLKHENLEIIIKEFEINNRPVDITRELLSLNADAIGFSVYIWNTSLLEGIVSDLRMVAPELFLFAGGPEASWSDFWRGRQSPLDVLVVGKGEGAVQKLLESLVHRKKNESPILISEETEFGNIDFPYTDDDWPALRRRYVYFESSRGCPFSCTYCLSSREDAALEELDAGRSIERLTRIVENGPFLIKFVDRTFNSNPRRARTIWKELISKHADSGSRFHFEVHPALLDDEDFSILKNAPEGFFQFEIGVQTIHERTRKIVKRYGIWDDEKKGILKLAEAGIIHIHLDLIAGLPGETMDDILASLDEVYSSAGDHIQLGFLKGLPGSPIRTDPPGTDACYQNNAPYEILSNASLKPQELMQLGRIAILLENLVNNEKLNLPFHEMAGTGSLSSILVRFERWAVESGYDIRTREGHKVMDAFSRFLQESSPSAR